MDVSNLITEEFLDKIGFKLVSLERGYGKAIDKRTNGMTILQWNVEGHSCTYFGGKLEPNVAFGIKKDAGTRTAFSGYVFTREDIKRVIELTW
jgi:hypothetical protein